MAKGLGRKVPGDWKHYEKFPLTAASTPTAAPVIWGINWYESFDNPQRHSNGEYWIGEGELGGILGGHAIAQPMIGARDLISWYEFYDQGSQGACVGFSTSRAMSWLNRKKYDADWLYHVAQTADEWEGEDYEGTSVRAAAEVLRTIGHKPYGRAINLADGIQAYRWINDVNDVLNVVGGEAKRRGAITWRNSWGTYYPQKVWLPAETAQRLIDEDGEVCVFTDR